jgi:transcriptional regulator GlxA family with amidase domain
MQISIVAFDRFTDIDVFMPWDLLFRAKSAGASDWDIRILGKTDHVTSVAGLKIPTHGRLDETKDSGAVIFASGIGVEDVLKDRDFLDALHLDESRQLIGSMCAGAIILAEKGLLKGRKATTYPTYFKRLATYEGVEPVEEPFVPNGNVATAGGCLAAQLLCGWIMEKLVSIDLADAVLASILPVGQGCKAFAGWGDPAAAKRAAQAAAAKAQAVSPQAAE